MNRAEAQNLITALDLNRMTLSEARTYAKRRGRDVVGRTKAQFIKNLCRSIEP